MKSRKELLKDLVFFKRDIKNVKKQLSSFSWDLENPLLTIDKSILKEIIYKAINDDITSKNLEDWAEAIECRDDIDFHPENLIEIIFELANTDINGPIEKSRLIEILNSLD